MFGIAPLTPAYGRDYKSKKEAQADLDASVDFRASDGRYINLDGLRRTGLSSIECRSRDLRRLWILKI